MSALTSKPATEAFLEFLADRLGLTPVGHPHAQKLTHPDNPSLSGVAAVQLVAESHVFLGCMADHTWGEEHGFRLMIDTCKPREDLEDMETRAIDIVTKRFDPDRVDVYHLVKQQALVRRTTKKPQKEVSRGLS